MVFDTRDVNQWFLPPSTLMLRTASVDYPQTRKPVAFPMLGKIGSAIDSRARLKVQAVEREALFEEEEDTSNPKVAAKIERKVAALKVISPTPTMFTETVFFKRVSGDLGQVAGGKSTGRSREYFFDASKIKENE